MLYEFRYDDGGRGTAGYLGSAGDCVTRSIAIATGREYREVYAALATGMAARKGRHNSNGKRSARNGVYRTVYEPYLESLGWEWTPTMHIGSGCKVHLRADELPEIDRMVIAVSKHLTAVVCGEVRDTHDPSRDGMRCVYGYYQQTFWP